MPPTSLNENAWRKRCSQFNAELQARNAELDAFAHTVAHDIKNPLHLLIGYADVLAENYARLPAETIAESLRVHPEERPKTQQHHR